MTGPGAEDLDGASVRLAAATQVFSVDGNKLAGKIRTDVRNKSGKAFGEGNRIDGGKDAQESVGARDAVGKWYLFPQRVLARLGKADEVLAGVHAA